MEGTRSSFWLMGNGNCRLNIPLLEMDSRRTIFLLWSNTTSSSSILAIQTMPKRTYMSSSLCNTMLTMWTCGCLTEIE